MTEINTASYTKKWRFIFLMVIVVLVFGILYIYKYNQLVALRFQEKNLKKEIEIASAKQNELKSRLFLILDPRQFDDIAKKNNLVVDNTPNYLILKKWLSERTF